MPLINIMAEKLGLTPEFIMTIAKRSNHYYRSYKIKKRNGGERNIRQPAPSLKLLQYWVVNNIFCHLPISAYSTAYSVGCSIKKNAERHKNSNFTLHMDIDHYFETITQQHIADLLEENQHFISKHIVLDKEDIKLICWLCTFWGSLTIGSVCSPIISNCIMYKFDLEIRRILPENIIYTRYADDMVFSSGMKIPDEIISLVTKTAGSFGFAINENKTYFASTPTRKQVTGLVINKGSVTIGLKRRKEIKGMIYKKLKYGIGNSEKILGHLFFLKDIEPAYYADIMVKYSSYGNVLELIKSNNSQPLDILGHKLAFEEVAPTIEV